MIRQVRLSRAKNAACGALGQALHPSARRRTAAGKRKDDVGADPWRVASCWVSQRSIPRLCTTTPRGWNGSRSGCLEDERERVGQQLEPVAGVKMEAGVSAHGRAPYHKRLGQKLSDEISFFAWSSKPVLSMLRLPAICRT